MLLKLGVSGEFRLYHPQHMLRVDSWLGARVTPAQPKGQMVWKRHRSTGLGGASEPGPCIGVEGGGGLLRFARGNKGQHWSVAALPGIREYMQCVTGSFGASEVCGRDCGALPAKRKSVFAAA